MQNDIRVLRDRAGNRKEDLIGPKGMGTSRFEENEKKGLQ
jgi:hypothetical protein